MKKLLNLLFMMMVVITFVNCDSQQEELIIVPPSERVEGYVTDEQGSALQEIRVEVFLDEQLSEPFDMLSYNINENGEYIRLIEDEKWFLTDEDGYYSQSKASRWKKGDSYEIDIYIVATDPAEIYASQMKKGQLVYDHESKVGFCRVDLVLSKK